MYVKAQLIDLSHIVLMLSSNTVSNNKGYFDIQNILSELPEPNGYYILKDFRIRLHPDSA